MIGCPSTREQVIALHSLYGRWEKHALQLGDDDARSTRLQWASEAIGRTIDSFSDLTRDEARELIDRLKGSIGQDLTQMPNPWRHIRSRDRAKTAGTSGRGDGDTSLIQLASPDDLARVNAAVERLGWTRERYDTWLCSPSSPVASKRAVAILTVADANKVWWALKNMLKRSGNWEPRRPAKRIRRTV